MIEGGGEKMWLCNIRQWTSQLTVESLIHTAMNQQEMKKCGRKHPLLDMQQKTKKCLLYELVSILLYYTRILACYLTVGYLYVVYDLWKII